VGWAVLDMVSKRKIPNPRWISNPDHPSVPPLASRYTHRTIPPRIMLSKTVKFFQYVFLTVRYLTCEGNV
jgi:hypothetical protein